MKNEQRGERLREALATAERAGLGRPYPESLRRGGVGVPPRTSSRVQGCGR